MGTRPASLHAVEFFEFMALVLIGNVLTPVRTPGIDPRCTDNRLQVRLRDIRLRDTYATDRPGF